MSAGRVRVTVARHGMVRVLVVGGDPLPGASGSAGRPFDRGDFGQAAAFLKQASARATRHAQRGPCLTLRVSSDRPDLITCSRNAAADGRLSASPVPGRTTPRPRRQTKPLPRPARTVMSCSSAARPGSASPRLALRSTSRQLRAGAAAAYIDLGQIGFISPVPAHDPGGHRLKARNLAGLWRTYHAAGARRLVLSGPVPDERADAVYAGALPAARLTVCRLHAGPAELARRISHCGQGLSWPLRRPLPKPKRWIAQASVTCASTPTAEPLHR
jgi:hypothetical protein